MFGALLIGLSLGASSCQVYEDCTSFCNGTCPFRSNISKVVPEALTVYRITPWNVTGISDHNTGDVEGDMGFLLLKYMENSHCTPPYNTPECFLDDKPIVGQFDVIFDGQYGPYLKCNPTYIGNTKYVDTGKFQCAYQKPGQNPWATDNSPNFCAAPCQRVNVSIGKDPAYHTWNNTPAAKKKVTSYFGGFWYSTPRLGQCGENQAPGDGSGCTWKVTSTPKYANASCVANQLFRVLKARNPSCFSQCGPGAGRGNKCFGECVTKTVLGYKGQPGVEIADMVTAWTSAFSGACPILSMPPALLSSSSSLTSPSPSPSASLLPVAVASKTRSLFAPRSASCTNALIATCGKESKDSQCLACVDAHQPELLKDGCTLPEVHAFCQPAPPSPSPAIECARAQELYCGNDRFNKTLCEKCVELHEAVLAQSKCTAVGDIKWCEGAPTPNPTPICYGTLAEYCEPERMLNHSICIKCATKHEKEIEAAHCTYTQVESFCSTKPVPPPGPPPPPTTCKPALTFYCAKAKAAGGVKACEMCEQENALALSKAGCTTTEEHEYCTPTPGPTPACTKEFTLLCGQQKSTHDACIKCADEHNSTLRLSGCTQTAITDLCNVPPPPGPVCYKVLYEDCEGVRSNPTTCMACAEKHEAESKCTLAEVASFCHATPAPPPPATCAAVLQSECGADKHKPTLCKACVSNHADHLKRANCTLAVEEAFCKALPPPPPPPPHPSPPSPSPPPNECVKVMETVCGNDRGNTTRCVQCLEAHHNKTLKAKCTYTQEAAFCKIGPPPPGPPSPPPGPPSPPPSPPHPPSPPAPPSNDCMKVMIAFCAKNKGKDAVCLKCLESHQNETLKAKCTREEEVAFCKPTPPPSPPPPGPACLVSTLTANTHILNQYCQSHVTVHKGGNCGVCCKLVKNDKCAEARKVDQCLGTKWAHTVEELCS